MQPVTGYVKLRDDTQKILCEVGELLGDLSAAPASGTLEDAHLPMDEQLKHFWELYYHLKSRHSEEVLSVAVLALAKSGKSTLLNAFLGQECLPVNNVPETATITKICHDPGAEEAVMALGDSVYRGCSAIRETLQLLNQQARSGEYRPLAGEVLRIDAPIAALNVGTQENSSVRIHLLDTPGPNEAGGEALRHQVERLLDGVDAVIYLLDYTKLKTVEEEDVFKRLKNINPQLVQRLAQRLFFVVNKLDQIGESEGMEEDEIREYVADLVTRQLSCEGFELKPEQVLLVSARNGLLARLVLGGSPSEEVLRRFMRVAFGHSWRRLGELPMSQLTAPAERILEDSGLGVVEQRVLDFLYRHGGSVKQLALLDDMNRLLAEVANVSLCCYAALQQHVDVLVARTNALQEDLQKTLDDFDQISSQTNLMQQEISDEIRGRIQDLRERLLQYVTEVLKADETLVLSCPSTWKRVRTTFLQLLRGGRRSRSKDEICDRLIELHDDLVRQIHEEVASFWGTLEACANVRHRSLVECLNAQLRRLTPSIEKAVADKLEISLDAVVLQLHLPTAEEFHVDLSELIARGISEQEERHVRIGQRRMEGEGGRMRHGLCGWGRYWQHDCPRTRTVVETYSSVVYQLEPDILVQHFTCMIERSLSATERAVNGYVRHYVKQQLDKARQQIEEYGDRYRSSMLSALTLQHVSQDDRMAARDRMKETMERITALKAQVLEVQQETESLLPPQTDLEAAVEEEVVNADGLGADLPLPTTSTGANDCTAEPVFHEGSGAEGLCGGSWEQVSNASMAVAAEEVMSQAEDAVKPDMETAVNQVVPEEQVELAAPLQVGLAQVPVGPRGSLTLLAPEAVVVVEEWVEQQGRAVSLPHGEVAAERILDLTMSTSGDVAIDIVELVEDGTTTRPGEGSKDKLMLVLDETREGCPADTVHLAGSPLPLAEASGVVNGAKEAQFPDDSELEAGSGASRRSYVSGNQLCSPGVPDLECQEFIDADDQVAQDALEGAIPAGQLSKTSSSSGEIFNSVIVDKDDSPFDYASGFFLATSSNILPMENARMEGPRHEVEEEEGGNKSSSEGTEDWVDLADLPV